MNDWIRNAESASLSSVFSRPLTLELLEMAISEVQIQREHPTMLIASMATYRAAGRAGAPMRDRRLEDAARQACHLFFGAIACPPSTVREGCIEILGGAPAGLV